VEAYRREHATEVGGGCLHIFLYLSFILFCCSSLCCTLLFLVYYTPLSRSFTPCAYRTRCEYGCDAERASAWFQPLQPVL
jgi:hypothetical protein